MNKITPSQQSILDYLKEIRKYIAQEWHSPSDIGIHVGQQKYYSSSAWASPKCKSLVKKGFLERNDDGHYRLRENT